ncbi:MAG TPA: PIN domain-containing protein [Terriglobales bacterium]|jgi:predicted nucleic acid-binding protein|nr:PIN domain-containing protein [Terriglobales bacterium]
MSAKTFVDSNVLIYAYDSKVPGKQAKAQAALRVLWAEQTGVLSMQVLQEFYITVTRKIQQPLAREIARLVIQSYSVWCVPANPEDILAAFRIEDRSKLSFWDSLILASASRSGADRLLSEDLNSGQTVEGVRIENPFL